MFHGVARSDSANGREETDGGGLGRLDQLLERGGRSVLGTLPPGAKSPGIGKQDHRT